MSSGRSGRCRGRRLAGASGGLLFPPAIPARDGGLAAGVGLDPDGFRAYEAHFYAKDLWTNEAAARGRDARGAVLTGPMIVGEARFRRSEFFNDFLAPIDLGQLCVAILDDGTSAEMPRTHLSLYRSPRAEPFDERARATLARLLPTCSGRPRWAADCSRRCRPGAWRCSSN